MWELHADPEECEQRKLVNHMRGTCLEDPPLLGGWSPSPGVCIGGEGWACPFYYLSPDMHYKQQQS